MTRLRPVYYYATQLFALSTPFLIIPFLARVVGPTGLGLYGIGQSIALLASCLVEYGFLLSGARGLAKTWEDKGASDALISKVVGAKLIMSFGCIVVGVVLYPFVSGSAHWVIFYLAIALGIFQGHNPYWFFGGSGRILFVGGVDVATKFISLLLIFILIRVPEDVWLAFVAQIVAQLVGVAIALASAKSLRRATMRPNFAGGFQLLRSNVDIFLQNILGNFFTGATALVLSFASPAAAVGYYAGAERLTRAAMLPMTPLRQTFFPSTVSLIARDVPAARLRVRRVLLIATAINFCGFLVLFFGAHVIVQIALGPKFDISADILRVLAIVPLFNAATDITSTLWLLPNHRDRYCTLVVMATTLIHVTFVFGFSRLWGPVGTGWAVFTSSAFCLTCMLRGVLTFKPSLLGGRK